MRILILNYEFPPLGGGAANATKYILEKFSKYKDLEIDLVTSSTNTFRVENFSENIKIHYMDIGKNNKNIHNQSNKEVLSYGFKSYSYSKKLMKKNSYDLVHAFFGIPSGFIAKLLKKPYIISLRGSDVPFYSEKYETLDKYIFKWLSPYLWKHSSFTIGNSKDLVNLAKESSTKQEIGLIYNGIDTEEFKQKKTYSTKGPLRIVSQGRLTKRKGFMEILETMKEFKYSDVQLTIIGNGSDYEILKKNSKGLHVEFKKYIEHSEMSEEYKKADIFLLNSLNEGMSNALLEALASGLPCISTNTGGADFLVKKDNGIIIPFKDNVALKKSIVKMISLKKSGELKKLGNNSRKIGLTMNWNKVAEEYYLKYKQTCKK